MINPFFKNIGPFKVFEILDLLSLDTKQASSDIIINDIKDLSTSNENDITFFHSKKYKSIANNTKALFCITTENLKNELHYKTINYICNKYKNIIVILFLLYFQSALRMLELKHELLCSQLYIRIPISTIVLNLITISHSGVLDQVLSARLRMYLQ